MWLSFTDSFYVLTVERLWTRYFLNRYIVTVHKYVIQFVPELSSPLSCTQVAVGLRGAMDSALDF